MFRLGKTLDDYLGKIVPGPPVPPEGTIDLHLPSILHSLNQPILEEILTCHFTFMLLSIQAIFYKSPKVQITTHFLLSTRAYIYNTVICNLNFQIQI